MMELKDIEQFELDEICDILSMDKKKIVLKKIFPELEKRKIKVCIICFIPELGFSKEQELDVVKKIVNLNNKISNAFDEGFYFEWISLLLIIVEFWLRTFLYNKGNYEGKNVLTDSLTFGQLIFDCKKSGMDSSLVKKLQKINKTRIQYIHNFLKVKIDDSDIIDKKIEYSNTLEELDEYVKNNSFRFIQTPDDYDNIVGFVCLKKAVTK